MTPHHNQRGHTVTDWVLMRNFEFGANLLAVSHGSIFALKASAQVGTMDNSSPESRLTLGQIVHSIFNNTSECSKRSVYSKCGVTRRHIDLFSMDV